jgi:hypothetical protein
METENTEKQYFFYAGMPESGNALGLDIFQQNPNIHVGRDSGLVELLNIVRNSFDSEGIYQFQNNPIIPEQRINILKGLLDSYYENKSNKIIFDDSCAWLQYAETLETILGVKPKFIFCVRNIVDILASFEKKYIEDKKLSSPSSEKTNFMSSITQKGRCDLLIEDKGPLGMAFNRLQDALNRGWKEQIHFVEYNDLTNDPENTIKKIYEFLEVEYYEHDYSDIKQTLSETKKILTKDIIREWNGQEIW